jgi:hypothetical protein
MPATTAIRLSSLVALLMAMLVVGCGSTVDHPAVHSKVIVRPSPFARQAHRFKIAYGSPSTPVVGETFTVGTGHWTRAVASYSYQWQRCTGVSGGLGTGCSDIDGATSRSYEVTGSDANDYLAAVVTAHFVDGGSGSVVSKASGQVPGGTGGTSISASPSSMTDGANATITINDANNNAGDYFLELNGGSYVNYYYVNSCTQTQGGSPATFKVCTIATGAASPGTNHTWQLNSQADAVLATSNAQTLTPDPTIGTCPTAEPSGSITLNSHSFTLLKRDDFNSDQASGSAWNSGSSAYTGDQGTTWGEYTDGSKSTFGTGQYWPSQVQSVHDGVLDWYLHEHSSGVPASANPAPYLSSGNQYETYGAFSICEKITPANDGHWLDNYKQAILLWPTSDGSYQYAESDFPEGNMADAVNNATGMKGFMCYYAHYGGSGSQASDCTDSIQDPINLNAWHVYTQAWGPGWRAYYFDGNLISTTTTSVYGSAGSNCTNGGTGGVPGNCGQRWQLQVEEAQNVSSSDGGAGHVYVDWAAVWSY